jgi:hypothetical protein
MPGASTRLGKSGRGSDRNSIGIRARPNETPDLEPLAVGGGWGGRIRTFNLLIQSQLRYRCATPQVSRLLHCSSYRLVFGADPRAGNVSEPATATCRPIISRRFSLPAELRTGALPPSSEVVADFVTSKLGRLDPVDPLRPRGFYPPWGFFICAGLWPATKSRLATTPG